jgi:hypothetical protein
MPYGSALLETRSVWLFLSARAQKVLEMLEKVSQKMLEVYFNSIISNHVLPVTLKFITERLMNNSKMWKILNILAITHLK